ncbi:MAG: hypothetical protein OEY27_07270 [Gammaproteobacteria bacterium]|nr:hypothetical protein [Gammaproteobacteria bacterium]
MEHGRCPFEKAILSSRCDCGLATRFSVAERMGVNCRSDIARNNCTTLLALMRDRARFALKVTDTSDHLPFGKEIKVMIGGLVGLQSLITPADAARVDDIHGLVRQAQEQYGSLMALPYHEIVKSITAYRSKRRGRGNSR